MSAKGWLFIAFLMLGEDTLAHIRTSVLLAR